MRIPEGFSPELNSSAVLTADELENVRAKASLRRLSVELGKQLAKVTRHEEVYGGSDYGKQLMAEISLEMAGKNPIALPPEVSAQRAINLEQQAEQANRDHLFNLAAFRYAKAAKLKQAAGVPFAETLEQARIAIAKNESVPKDTPNAFLPEAIVFGVQNKIAQGALPNPERMAAYLKNSQSFERGLLADYALAASEEYKSALLAALPQDKREKALAFINHTLAKFRDADSSATDADLEHQHVREETGGALEARVKDPDKRSQYLVKILSATLAELAKKEQQDFRSKNLLQESAKQSLVGLKDKEKDKTRTFVAARLLMELGKVDEQNAANLALKFMAQAPDRLFILAAREMVRRKHLVIGAESYLPLDYNKAEVASHYSKASVEIYRTRMQFLRRLAAEYPNQVNTTLDTISRLCNNQDEVKDFIESKQKDIFAALKDLGGVTPVVFKRYLAADVKGRKELADKISNLKPKFFQNHPIQNILTGRDKEILQEMVYLAYRPVNIDYTEIKRFLDQLEDCTEHLDGYEFPQEGYDFVLGRGKEHHVRLGERVDFHRLNEIADWLRGKYPQEETDKQELKKRLVGLAQASTTFKDKDIGTILSLLAGDEMVQRFSKLGSLSEQNGFSGSNQALEILSVYFKDNFSGRLKNFLQANPSIWEDLQHILKIPKRAENLLRQMGQAGKHFNVNDLIDMETASIALAQFLHDKYIKPEIGRLKKTIGKFELTEATGSSDEGRHLKAYISKNAASFFAKASAGICTSGDIPLFLREDHFHLNIVEGGEFVRGNIQCYFIEYPKGQKALLLRGLNPNTEFLKDISAADFVEEVFRTAKQFCEENGLKGGVYLSEGLSGWHADSNRPEVRDYLAKTYFKETRQKDFRFKITDAQSIGKIYEIFGPDKIEIKHQPTLEELDAVSGREIAGIAPVREKFLGLRESIDISIEETNPLVSGNGLSGNFLFISPSSGKEERTVEAPHWRSISTPAIHAEVALSQGQKEFFYEANTKGCGYLKPSAKGFRFEKYDHWHIVDESGEHDEGYKVLGLSSRDDYFTYGGDILQKANRLLEAGLRTECYYQIAKVDRLPFQGQMLTIAELKKRGVIPKRKGYQPYEAVRLLKTNSRVEEAYQSPERARELFERAFTAFNQETKDKNLPSPQLNIESPEHQRVYLQEYFRNMGHNMAVLLNVGYSHFRLHASNLTMAAEVCDVGTLGPWNEEDDERFTKMYNGVCRGHLKDMRDICNGLKLLLEAAGREGLNPGGRRDYLRQAFFEGFNGILDTAAVDRGGNSGQNARRWMEQIFETMLIQNRNLTGLQRGEVESWGISI